MKIFIVLSSWLKVYIFLLFPLYCISVAPGFDYCDGDHLGGIS